MSVIKKSRYKNLLLESLAEEKIEYSSTTGLQKKLSSETRTEQLTKIAKERGQRLRTIREQINKTLEEFSKALNMNAGNLGRIERGEICLSLLFADWITKNVINYGIIVTNTWLLSGKGVAPQFIINEPLSLCSYLKEKIESKIDISQSKDLTEQEKDVLLMNHMIIFLYQQANPNSIVTYVKDTKMEPVLFKGNIIGGNIVKKGDYGTLHNKDCILVINNNMIIRHVLVIDNKFILSTHTDKKDLKLVDDIEKAAIINFKMCSSNNNDFNNIPVETEYDNVMFDVLQNKYTKS